MLPAFAAAFLGSTQFHGGRFNVAGTLIAVVVLAVGVKGLQLAGAPIWLPDLFNGVALLAAVGFAQFQKAPPAPLRSGAHYGCAPAMGARPRSHPTHRRR